MKIIERIFEYIKYKGVTIADFERQNSLSNGYLRKMKQRNADIGETIMLTILENCPDIALDWFVLGEGTMLKTDTPDDGTKTEEETTSDGVTAALERIIQRQAKEIARLEIELEKYRPDGGGQ